MRVKVITTDNDSLSFDDVAFVNINCIEDKRVSIHFKTTKEIKVMRGIGIWKVEAEYTNEEDRTSCE